MGLPFGEGYYLLFLPLSVQQVVKVLSKLLLAHFSDIIILEQFHIKHTSPNADHIILLTIQTNMSVSELWLAVPE